MPRIPSYQRQNTVTSQAPNALTNVGAAGIVGQAISGAGNALGDAADIIYKRQEEIKKEEQYYSTQRIGNLVNDDALTFEQEGLSRKGTDAFNSMELADKWAKDATEKHTKDITDDKLKFAVTQHIQSQALKIKNSFATHESRERDLVAEDTRKGTLESAAKSAYQGFGTLDDNMQVFNQAIINDPRLRDTDKENKLIAGQSAIAESRLDGVVNRNPAAAVEMIKSGMFNQFLDKKKIDEFDVKANALAKAQESDVKTAAKEAERLAKEQLKLDRDKTANEFIGLLVNGKLSKSAVLKSNLEPTGENSKEHWINEIEQLNEKRKKAAKGDGEFTTDKGLSGKLFRKIVADPDSVTDVELAGYVGNGLSQSSASELITLRQKRIKGEIDPARVAGEKAVIENLKRDRKAGLFGENAEGDLEYAKQTEALKRWMTTHPNDDPSDYYEKLTEPNKTGFVQGIFDRALGGFYEPEKPDLKKRREELAGTPAVDKWLVAAKKANPSASESDLKAYYNKKYGAR